MATYIPWSGFIPITVPLTALSLTYLSVVVRYLLTFIVAASLLLLSIYKATRYSSPWLTCVVCSLYGSSMFFSSPQSRNAPILLTSHTLSLASPPSCTLGLFVVAISLSLESLYINTVSASPISISSGTCFLGSKTLSSSVPRYTPKSVFLITLRHCVFPSCIMWVAPFYSIFI